MGPATYEVRCLWCSTEVGLIRGGRFMHDPACGRPLARPYPGCFSGARPARCSDAARL